MFTGKFVMKNGKLTYDTPKDKLAYEIFLEKLKEGQRIEMYLDLANSTHSKAQLAKVHACIRELAIESGYTFADMKLLIKHNAGLEGKSFAECSTEELMLAIESCIQIGKENYNINLS
jgi:hypothetical protein